MILIKNIFDQLNSRVNPQSESGIAFLNYLKTFCYSDENWSYKRLNEFFLECLVYPHWQQNKQKLRDEVQSLLASFQYENRVDLELEKVQWVTDFQVVSIEKTNDWKDLLETYLKDHVLKEEKSKYRFVLDGSSMYTLILDPGFKGLQIRVFDNKFTIFAGKLIPLRDFYSINFDNHLNLMESFFYNIELGPFVRGRFYVKNGLYDFFSTRGYLFQSFQSFQKRPLEAIPRLFYPLKKIENIFLKKDSNPFYTMLIHELEQKTQMIRKKEPINSKEMMDLLVQARNALEYVFNGDKLLHLLVKELEERVTLKPVESSSMVEVKWSLPRHEILDSNSLSEVKKGTPLWPDLKNDELFDLTDS